MVQDFTLIHRRGSQNFSTSYPDLELWQTCIRRMLMGLGVDKNQVELTAGDDFLQGREAYKFCLEIVCGLHSPILGETEVHGQFKTWLEGLAGKSENERHSLIRVLKNVETDAKRVRTEHLNGLGSQSYGSWLRKRSQGQPVHLLGSGQLVREVLPWLQNHKFPVVVHSRKPQQARDDLKSFRFVEVADLAGDTEWKGIVVVAAPLRASELSVLFECSPEMTEIVDFRADSNEDPIDSSCRVVTLQEVFAELEDHQWVAKNRVASAQEMIDQLAGVQLQHSQNRPFGWEDLCG
jgi:glutamyl-tRNA reductase